MVLLRTLLLGWLAVIWVVPSSLASLVSVSLSMASYHIFFLVSSSFTSAVRLPFAPVILLIIATALMFLRDLGLALNQINFMIQYLSCSVHIVSLSRILVQVLTLSVLVFICLKMYRSRARRESISNTRFRSS